MSDKSDKSDLSDESDKSDTQTSPTTHIHHCAAHISAQRSPSMAALTIPPA